VVAFHFLAFFLKKKENGTFAGLKPHSASPMPLPHHADHKTAISNHHLQQISEQHTTFRYKDYKANGFRKQMTLSHGEFIRRFAQHILPLRFVRIRHYGILSSTWKRVKFAALKQRLNIPLLQHTVQQSYVTAPAAKRQLHTITILPIVAGFVQSCRQAGASLLALRTQRSLRYYRLANSVLSPSMHLVTQS
jgi:hypothetical protein